MISVSCSSVSLLHALHREGWTNWVLTAKSGEIIGGLRCRGHSTILKPDFRINTSANLAQRSVG